MLLYMKTKRGQNKILSTMDWVVHYQEDPVRCSKRLETCVLVTGYEANRYTPVGDSGRASSRGIRPEKMRV